MAGRQHGGAARSEGRDLVYFRGLVPHYSAPNRSAVSRHAFTLHVTDARTVYSARNWIQRDAGLPVRGLNRTLGALKRGRH